MRPLYPAPWLAARVQIERLKSPLNGGGLRKSLPHLTLLRYDDILIAITKRLTECAVPTPPPMDPLIRRVHHTAVSVRDFARTKAFYTDFLGFVLEDEMERRDEPALGRIVGLPGAVVDWAILRRGDYRVELFTYREPVAGQGPVRQCDVGYTHLALEVDDVDAAFAEAQRAGYATLSEPQELRGGRTKVFYLEGPEGIVVEFIEIRPRPAG